MSQDFRGDDSAAIREMETLYGDAAMGQPQAPVTEQPAAPAAAKKPDEPAKAPTEAKKDEAKPDEKPQLSFEELHNNYKNVQGALASTRAEAREQKRLNDALAKQVETLQREMLRVREQTGDIEPINPQQQAATELEQMRAQMQEMREAQERQAAERELTEYTDRGEREFVQKAPDFQDAVIHLATQRLNELAFLMPDTPQMQEFAASRGFSDLRGFYGAMIQAEFQGMAKQAQQYGRNPAEMIYNVAKQRGYQGKAAQQQQAASQQIAPQNGQQAHAQATSIQIQAPSPVGTIRRGQEAAVTLNGGGVRSSNEVENLSLDELANLFKQDPVAGETQFKKMVRAGLIT